MITASHLARAAYCLEFLLFAVPLYVLAAVLAPFGAFLIVLAPLALPAYIINVMTDPYYFIALGYSVALGLFIVSAYVALWYLAKLSLTYIRKGASALVRQERDFKIGSLAGLYPAIIMSLIGYAFSIEGNFIENGRFIFWLGLPPFILAAHLWLVLRHAQTKTASIVR